MNKVPVIQDITNPVDMYVLCITYVCIKITVLMATVKDRLCQPYKLQGLQKQLFSKSHAVPDATKQHQCNESKKSDS